MSSSPIRLKGLRAICFGDPPRKVYTDGEAAEVNGRLVIFTCSPLGHLNPYFGGCAVEPTFEGPAHDWYQGLAINRCISFPV